MKKWLSIILACMMTLCALPALGEAEFPEADGATDAAETQDNWVEYDYDHLTVGNPTQMNGMFFTDLWGSNTSDIDVRMLVNGYNLVTWDSDVSMFRFDHSVVSSITAGDDKDGNRRYLISLYDDLHYSDGTPIRTWDYAFSVLLQCDPVIEKLGGKPANYNYLLGYEDYVEGKSDSLAGLSVIDDYNMVFIVKKDSLPYFYELSRFNLFPYPIQTIAPGCKVYDNGAGVFIGNENPDQKALNFSEELLQKTILAPQTGYLVHPVPSSGPYTISSFDGTTAKFNVNPWYKGNEDGDKPRIATITYTHAQNESMIADLGTGQFALLNKVTLAQAIQEGMALCTKQNQFTRATYPRTGLTYFYFIPSKPIVQSEKVRKALAYCLDQSQFIKDYVGPYGLEAYGLYGLSQWMYQLAMGTMEYTNPDGTPLDEETQKAWEAINLDNLAKYPFNLEEAVSLLEEDGWTLNEQGQPFNAGMDSVRCREEDGVIQPLELTIAYTKALEIEQPLTKNFLDNLAQAGIRTTLIQKTIGQLEDTFDGLGDADCDLLYLGNNFSIAFDPSAIFATGAVMLEDGMAEDSLPAVHSELYRMSLDLDHTEPADVLSYMQKWLRFQERLSETLPILPVYINVYFDFYTRELHEYWIADESTWAEAIVPARMYDADEMQEEEIDQINAEYEMISNESGQVDLDALQRNNRVREAADPTAGALAAFPKEVRDQIPVEYRTINEFITASLSEFQNVESTMIQFGFETKYRSGETVYLIFGITGKNNTKWFVQPGKVQKDGSVRVTLDKDQLEQLAGRQFPLVVVSRQ